MQLALQNEILGIIRYRRKRLKRGTAAHAGPRQDSEFILRRARKSFISNTYIEIAVSPLFATLTEIGRGWGAAQIFELSIIPGGTPGFSMR